MSFSETTRARAREIIARSPADRSRSALRPLLHRVQSEEGYVSPAGVEFCAEVLGLNKAQVGAVATFYTMYKRKPTGDYLVSVCTNTMCDVLGGQKVYDTLAEHLGVGHEETTADGKITLEHAECLAACDYGPVMTVNYDFFDNVEPQAALDAMKAYADLGGRVFASHWHNIWISGHYQGNGNGQSPAVWDEIAEWVSGENLNTEETTIDEVDNPKGASFATWMLNVMGSPAGQRGLITVNESRITATSVDTAKAERWVYLDRNGRETPQIFQFTTPNEAAQNSRCGKVVFSDMHVSADSASVDPFPSDCANSPLTPQEKALAFMFFDIASCVAAPIF